MWYEVELVALRRVAPRRAAPILCLSRIRVRVGRFIRPLDAVGLVAARPAAIHLQEHEMHLLVPAV
jgi:hypothetical protein